MIMQQKVLLAQTAVEVAQEAARLWVEDNGLYYRLFEDDFFHGDQEITYTVAGEQLSTVEGEFYRKKFALMRQMALAKLEKALRKPENTELHIHYDNNLLIRSITVTLRQELSIPLGNLRMFFNDQSFLTIEVTGKATITDPAEYIRNIDLALEYGSKAVKAIDFKTVVEKIKEGVGK